MAGHVLVCVCQQLESVCRMPQKQSCRCQLWMGRMSSRWGYQLWHHLYPQH